MSYVEQGLFDVIFFIIVEGFQVDGAQSRLFINFVKLLSKDYPRQFDGSSQTLKLYVNTLLKYGDRL